MSNTMIVNVEFLAGTDIQAAAQAAKSKAGEWGVAYVCFNFNGIHLSIGANADINDVLEQWHSNEGKYGICAA